MVHIGGHNQLSHHRQGSIILDSIDDIAFRRTDKPGQTLEGIAHPLGDDGLMKGFDGIGTFIGFDTRNQQTAYAVGGCNLPACQQIIPFQFLPLPGIPGKRGQKLRTD